MADLPACRLQQYGAFTSAQAHAFGLTRHQVQWLLRVDRLVSLRRGVYADRSTYDAMSLNDQSRARAVAACLARPGSVISHHSAALIHGLPFLDSRPARPALTIPARSGARGERDSSVEILAAQLPEWHVERRTPTWAITTVARTVCDLARREPPLNVLVALDSALSRRLTSRAAVSAVADMCTAWPGSSTFPNLLRLSDGGAESPYETVARWHLLHAGYSATAQVWAYDDKGHIGCGDIWLPALWTFLEVDGDVKYDESTPTSLVAEKRRQERLERAGFGVARVSAGEARSASLVITRIEHEAARGRYSRLTMRRVVGYVGPPPPWATRGAHMPITLAPT